MIPKHVNLWVRCVSERFSSFNQYIMLLRGGEEEFLPSFLEHHQSSHLQSQFDNIPPTTRFLELWKIFTITSTTSNLTRTSVRITNSHYTTDISIILISTSIR